MESTVRLQLGDRVGVIACSDGLKMEYRPQLEQLIQCLGGFGLSVVTASTLMRKEHYFSGSPKERAQELHYLFADDQVAAIFDVSGGDSANQVLPHLDFELIRNHPKPFFGMSDLSVLLNSIYFRGEQPTYHYQLMNLVHDASGEQREQFYRTFLEGKSDLFQVHYEWLRGDQMQGILIGGNLRCFLKLAGTPYLPSSEGKIILLESLTGRANRIVSYIAQLGQMGVFNFCAGVILGKFSEVEQNSEQQIVLDYIMELTASRQVPVARTTEIGHGRMCKCMRIGRKLTIAG